MLQAVDWVIVAVYAISTIAGWRIGRRQKDPRTFVGSGNMNPLLKPFCQQVSHPFIFLIDAPGFTSCLIPLLFLFLLFWVIAIMIGVDESRFGSD